MKKLLFDLVATQPNVSGKRHGGGKYGEIIFFRMIERGLLFDCFYDSSKWLNPDVENLARLHGCILYDVAVMTLENIVDEGKYENLYSALPNKGILKFKKCNVICTLHGLRGYETPVDRFFWKYPSDLKSKLKWIIQKTAWSLWKRKLHQKYKDYFYGTCQLITVSEHSKAAIQSYYPKCQKDIKVFYSPNTSSKTPSSKILSSEKYFLMVSGNRWEKNNLRAILAFDRLVSAGLMKDTKAIVTGCKPGMYDKKVKNRSSFEFLGYVDESELDRLYANAYCFVYPSLNEGFGYPPLEAMLYSVPVIASPFSSISELLEGGALYFNPFSIEEIMNRMILIAEPKRHDEFAKAGYARYLKIKKRQDNDLDALIDYIFEKETRA